MNATPESVRLDETLSPHAGFYFHGSRLLESGTTPFQTYEVWETPELGKLFRLDGYFMTSERDEFLYHENLIHPAAITHADPASALIIGGGDGGSAEELFKHPNMNRVVLVELDAKVIDIARQHLHHVHRGSLDDPRLALRIADGLEYVRKTAPDAGERFDLIILDLTDPIGPAEALYTEQFFADCRALLNPDGALVIHTGAPLYTPSRVKSMIERLRATFRQVCPYFVYIPLYGSLWGMACASDSLDPAGLDPASVDRRIAERGLTRLRYYNGDTHRAVQALPNYLRELLSS